MLKTNLGAQRCFTLRRSFLGWVVCANIYLGAFVVWSALPDVVGNRYTRFQLVIVTVAVRSGESCVHSAPTEWSVH